MYQISGAVSICILMQILVTVKPFVYNSLVVSYNVSASFKNLVGVFKGNGKYPFIKYAAADGIIGSSVENLPSCIRILSYNPAASGSGHGVYL